MPPTSDPTPDPGTDQPTATSRFPTAAELPDPPQDDVIDPLEVPCSTDSGVHDPVVVEVLDDQKFGETAVVQCRQCGALCDPAVPWYEYKHVSHGECQ